MDWSDVLAIVVVVGICLVAALKAPWPYAPPPDVAGPPRPAKFLGWEGIHRGDASIGQTGPALRDLDKRLSALEALMRQAKDNALLASFPPVDATRKSD